MASHKGNDGTCELVWSAGSDYTTAEMDVLHSMLTLHCGCINVLHTTLHMSMVSVDAPDSFAVEAVCVMWCMICMAHGAR